MTQFTNSSSESVETPSFEAALAELQGIVHDLEEGQIGLEASLSRFEQGVHLLKNCYRILEQAEQRIEILTGTDADGNLETAPFDAQATMETTEAAPRKPGRRRTAPAKPTPVEEIPQSPSGPTEQSLF